MKDETADSYSHVLKYTGLFGGVQGLNMLIGLVRNKLVALLLGPSGMGLASLFNTAVNFISQATNMGISFSAVRHVSELFDEDDEVRIDHFIKVVRTWSLLTALLGFMMCVAVGPFLDYFSFSWGNHTLHFVLLAPAIFLLAVAGGETAILKGVRRLKELALIQVYNVFAALLIAVPVYYFFGESGIVPVIVLTGFVSLLLTIHYSYRIYPLRLRGAKGFLGEGMDMVKLGTSFTLAGVVGSASEMLIRSFLNVQGSLADVGLYNVGYMITVSYAGLVFTAMEADYYPRLSAVSDDVVATNLTVNRQMEVSLLLLAPMLAVLIMMLPLLIPMLFSNEFIAVVPMTQVAVLAMYLKAMTLPVAYITLARGYSMSFLLLETSYFVVLVALVIIGYLQWGLLGTGMAILGAHVFDYFMINGYAYWKYSYRCTSVLMRYAGVQTLLGIAAFTASCLVEGWGYWITETALVLTSTAYSLHILRKKTHLWESLKRRFRI